MLTRFELARVLGARALQIALGAPVLTELPKRMIRPAEVAQLEYEKGVLPLTVIRTMPNKAEIALNIKGEEIGKTKE